MFDFWDDGDSHRDRDRNRHRDHEFGRKVSLNDETREIAK